MSYLEMALRAAREMDEEAKRAYPGRTGAATKATKATKAPSVPEMPEGVKLIEWNPKRPPVAITSAAVVIDVDRYIERTLRLLGLALATGAQPDGRRVRELVDRLEQCGVVVRIHGVGSPSGGTQ